MTYWAEVTRTSNPKNRQYVLRGLIDSTSKLKPQPSMGGEDCISITRETYEILRVTHGDARRAREIATQASKVFVQTKESE